MWITLKNKKMTIQQFSKKAKAELKRRKEIKEFIFKFVKIKNVNFKSATAPYQAALC